VYYPIYWEEDDFGQIEAAIVNLFGRPGWLESSEAPPSNGRSRR
jgi:hypothetical protein